MRAEPPQNRRRQARQTAPPIGFFQAAAETLFSPAKLAVPRQARHPMPPRTPPDPMAVEPVADLLAELNPPQREAVTSTEGPLLVVAGAGSGKTRVITHRIAYLVSRGCPVDGVLAITFTNKAAKEMKQRTERLSGFKTPWISTFHSLAARILRRHIYRIEPYDTSFSILDRDDTKSLIKDILKAQKIDSRLWEPSGVLAEISRIKTQGEDEEEAFGSDYRYGQVLRGIYHRYLEEMARNNLLDFDDLLLLLVRLLEQYADVRERYAGQFRYVLIDEYQDTNAAQYRIARLLTQDNGNLCITGDPDQSIYSWRGADPSNFLHFERDYPEYKTVKLEQNYRSKANVLSTANALIAQNGDRIDKELWTENEAGDPVRVYRFENELEEARDIAQLIRQFLDAGMPCGDIAVFYRINSLSRPIEQELIFANIPYTIVGGIEFFLRKEIKDLLAWLRIVDNPRDSESLKRIINVPPRGIGKTTLEKLQEIAYEARRGLLETVLDPHLRSALSARQAKAIEAFRELYEGIAQRKDGPVEQLLKTIIAHTGFERYLEAQHGLEARERLENVSEFIGAAVEHDSSHETGTLTAFLELVAILGDVDRWQQSVDRVSLMTLHAAKGLEFPVAIIVGVEDGVLPLIRTDDPDPDIEEERRLLYVGITRAMEKLYLTHAATRMRFGQLHRATPSRYLRELLPLGEAAEDGFRRLEVDHDTEESLHRAQAARQRWDDIDPDPGWPDDGESGVDEFDSEERASSSELPAEPEFDVDEEPFPDGVRVLHDEYGEGIVVRSSGFGARRRVTVRFDESGEKQFLSLYSPLRRIR